MVDVAVATGVLAFLFLATGLPSALVTRRRSDGWVAVSADAVSHGLVWVPLGVTAWAWLGWWGAAPMALLWGLCLVLLGRGRVLLPVRRAGRPRISDLLLAVGWVALLVGALLLRLREVNFLPWVGDMGAYVNWANEFARTGELAATWPPLFPSFLTVSTVLFGPEHTTVGMTVVGMVLIVAVARLVHELGANRWAALAAGATLAFSVHAVWYSSFPSSESLNAPIFLLWVTLLLRLLSSDARRPVLLSIGLGLVMLALAMLRGSGGLLLVPLGAVLLIAAAVRGWRPYVWRLWWAVAACVVASAVAYWYGISEIRRYFVQIQLRDVLPLGVWARIQSLGYFEPTVWVLGGLIGTTALAIGIGTVVANRVDAAVPRGEPVGGEGAQGRVGAATLVAAAAGIGICLIWQAVTQGEVWAIAGRIGLILWVGTVVVVVVTGWLRRRDQQLVILLLALITAMFLVLHSSRLGGARTHAFYLYWDRYLVSEVLPVLVVLTFVGISWMVSGLGARPAGRRAIRSPRPLRTEGAAALVGAAVAALVVVPALPSLRLVTEDSYMRGAYALTAELSEIVGDVETPVYWSATDQSGVDGFFFPNTWMAFAVPLGRSFGHDVYNVNRGTTRDFGPDETLDGGTAPLVAACAEVNSFVVLEIDTGAPGVQDRIDRPGVTLTSLGTVEGEVMLLSQPADEGWTAVDFSVAAWRVHLSDNALVTQPPCWVLTSGGSADRLQFQ